VVVREGGEAVQGDGTADEEVAVRGVFQPGQLGDAGEVDQHVLGAHALFAGDQQVGAAAERACAALGAQRGGRCRHRAGVRSWTGFGRGRRRERRVPP
jgi:hypothetical protein